MKPDWADFLERYALSGVRAYVMTAVIVVAATALRVALNPVLGDSAPYTIQALVLLIIATLAGLGPSLFGLAIVLAGGWHAIPPYDQPLAEKLANELTTSIVGFMICFVTATMRLSLFAATAARRDADFLGRELHHRVKNLFAVVASMMTLSARDKPESREVLGELRSRVQALSEAHDLAMSTTDMVSLHDLLDRLMCPYHTPDGAARRIHMTGEPVDLPAGHITPLALIFHELATNAVKYGALSLRRGTIRVSWDVDHDALKMFWQEDGLPRQDQPVETGETGFGTLLVEASVAQLRGTLDRSLTDEGLRVYLSIPIASMEPLRAPSGSPQGRRAGWPPAHPSLSVLRDSRWFSRTRSMIRDLRS